MAHANILLLVLAGWFLGGLHPISDIKSEEVIKQPFLETTPTASVLSPTEPPEIKVLFGGQIVPGRCVQAGVDRHGNADYIYNNVRDVIQSADLAIAALNGSLTDSSPSIGCVDWSLMLNGAPIQADAMARAGFDGLSVATNHINNCTLNNCGMRPFQDTLMNLRRVGIVPIGGGENLAEALAPQVFTLHGVRFGFISLGEIEPNVFATDTRPGIAPLTKENLSKAIRATQEQADVVIVLPHWGSEYGPVPGGGQINYAHQAVAEGADLIVGTHTHVIQGQQKIDAVQVFYGLGNFVFDQSWELRLRSSLLVEVTFAGKEYRGYRIIPIEAKKDGTLYFPGEDERLQILADFERASKKIKP